MNSTLKWISVWLFLIWLTLLGQGWNQVRYYDLEKLTNQVEQLNKTLKECTK